MKPQTRHWFTVTTALVATIGAGLALAFGPTPSHDGGLQAGYGVHSALAVVTFVG